jgi:hypothetical protein
VNPAADTSSTSSAAERAGTPHPPWTTRVSATPRLGPKGVRIAGRVVSEQRRDDQAARAQRGIRGGQGTGTALRREEELAPRHDVELPLETDCRRVADDHLQPVGNPKRLRPPFGLRREVG